MAISTAPARTGRLRAIGMIFRVTTGGTLTMLHTFNGGRWILCRSRPWSRVATERSTERRLLGGDGSVWRPAQGIVFRLRFRKGLDLNGDRSGDVFLYNSATGIRSTLPQRPGRPGLHRPASARWDPGWQIHPARLNDDGLTDFFLYNPVRGLWVQAINQRRRWDLHLYSRELGRQLDGAAGGFRRRRPDRHVRLQRHHRSVGEVFRRRRRRVQGIHGRRLGSRLDALHVRI